MKRNEYLKKEYVKLAEVVNAYKSEQVQLVIVERLLPLLEKDFKGDHEETSPDVAQQVDTTETIVIKDPKPKQIGATKALSELLHTDFLTLPRTIGAIVNHCRETFEGVFETYQFSGVLAKMVQDHKLIRQSDTESSRFVYLKP